MADIRRNDGGYGEGIMSSGGSLGTRQTRGPGEFGQPEWMGYGSHRPGIGFEKNGRCVWCNCPVSAHHENCRFGK